MPTLTYVGPHDEVDVPDAGATCTRGGAIEVSEELAQRLLEQPSNWQPAKAADDKRRKEA